MDNRCEGRKAGELTEQDIGCAFARGLGEVTAAIETRDEDRVLAVLSEQAGVAIGLLCDALIKHTRMCDDIHALRVEMEARTYASNDTKR